MSRGMKRFMTERRREDAIEGLEKGQAGHEEEEEKWPQSKWIALK